MSLSVKLQPVLPKKLFANAANIPQRVREVQKAAAEKVREDYRSTKQGWRTRVDFLIWREGESTLAIGANPHSRGGEIYGYVDWGTRPHLIVPRRAKRLRFSVRGEVVWARRVRHPGFRGRGFTEQLQAKWDEEFPRMVQAAMAEEFGGE